jgi:beta-galactosidase
MDRGTSSPNRDPEPGLSRRQLLRAGAIGGAALAWEAAAAPLVQARGSRAAKKPKPSRASSGVTYNFNRGWRFTEAFPGGSQQPGYPDGGFARVTLPHTVTPLSWGSWEPGSWEKVCVYRKHFSGAKLTSGRVFLDFDGVMTDATVYLNGYLVGQHQGGFLPWSVELTDQLLAGKNVLAVVVDGRWLEVPPEGSPTGPTSIDYMVPAGIYRDVTLRLVPDVFIDDVWAKPGNVLSGAPTLQVQATIDASSAQRRKLAMTVELLEGSRVIATKTGRYSIRKGTNLATLTLRNLHGLTMWSPENPKLYTVRTKLSGHRVPSHTFTVLTGFREVAFTTQGFYLNGQRVQIFGLNRHQMFPYTGMAAPARLQAADADLIKNELNCNMVRCSHYPQSPHFLDACDQVGLMVWEEPPGWQYMGAPHFQSVVLQNVRDMVIRDRNRPSVVVWGTRLDETGNNYEQLYAETRALAESLDGTRATTGAMNTRSTAGWDEDVFAYDDYHTSGGNAILEPPIPGVPYMVSEAVGSIDGPPTYRWIDTSQTLGTQARMHAQVNNAARSDPAYCGLLAWSAVDYASLVGGARIWNNLKWGGVLDIFRVPKPGASFYRSQVDPAHTPVIAPAFYWDFGSSSPATGPGPNAMIATNCDQLILYLNGAPLTTGTPDTTDYGYLPYPPVFVDLTVDGSGLPTLRIDGYRGGTLVASLQMSSNPATDHLGLVLEDATLNADGFDATRCTFRALDSFGNQRPYVTGDVTLALHGPAKLIAQNPFNFQGYGGVGGAFVRSIAGRTGTVTVKASHPTLGSASASLRVLKATGKYL